LTQERGVPFANLIDSYNRLKKRDKIERSLVYDYSIARPITIPIEYYVAEEQECKRCPYSEACKKEKRR
jgi:hypothetical protein